MFFQKSLFSIFLKVSNFDEHSLLWQQWENSNLQIQTAIVYSYLQVLICKACHVSITLFYTLITESKFSELFLATAILWCWFHNHDDKKPCDVCLNYRYHLSNIVPDSIFHESIWQGIVFFCPFCFFLIFLCYCYFFVFFWIGVLLSSLFLFFCFVLFLLLLLFCYSYVVAFMSSLEWKRWSQFYH